MTAVAATSPDLRRRVAIALATLVAVLALPAAADAATYCVAPRTAGCTATVFRSKVHASANSAVHAASIANGRRRIRTQP